MARAKKPSAEVLQRARLLAQPPKKPQAQPRAKGEALTKQKVIAALKRLHPMD